MIKKFTIAVMATSILTATLFTGCSKKPEVDIISEETTVAETTVEETTEVVTEAPTEAPTEVPTEEETTKAEISLSKLYGKITQAASISGMYQLDDEDLMDYYGIDVAADCTEYVFYQGEVSPSVDTVALFQCKDLNAASNIKEGLEVVLTSIKDSTVDYAPDEYAKAEKAEVVVAGDFVYLVICNNADEAINVINEYNN